MEENIALGFRKNKLRFWNFAAGSIVLRLVLAYFAQSLNLSSRPEVSTPLTSLRRLAEGYWLKQFSLSPYQGSMYHGSPLLLQLLGPLTVKKADGLPNHLICSLVFVIADTISAILIRAIGRMLESSHHYSLKSLGLDKHYLCADTPVAGDIAALVYLWNPFTIITCVGFNTSPIENLFVILSIFGASAGIAPLAAFGWVIASHLSLYPLVLIIPMIFLLGYGSDGPPRKLFSLGDSKSMGGKLTDHEHVPVTSKPKKMQSFCWRRIFVFFFWASIWIIYVLLLCASSAQAYGGLGKMFNSTYGFILTVKDLAPNIGVLWYFFAEVFDFFRSFFLIVFHMNILFLILPLAIRLYHRPCFLAFVYLAISAIFKSYPSVGDSGLYLSFLALFVDQLAELKFSFFIFCGYVGVSLLSPVMHNLWIWRGTGNANFYFVTAMAYACFQIILVVESVNTMLNYDRKIRKLCKATSI